MGKRTRVILIMLPAVFLIAAGVFLSLVKSGKIKPKAETNTFLVNVQGVARDPSTNQPISNATVSISAIDINAITVQTDAEGNYRGGISIDPAREEQKMISLSIFCEDYPSSPEMNYYDVIIPSDAASGYTLTQDFNVSKPPYYEYLRNRTTNGDFEFGDAGWTFYKEYKKTTVYRNAVTQIVTSDKCYSGSGKCLQLLRGTATNVFAMQDVATKLEAGKTYRFAAMMKAVGGNATTQGQLQIFDKTAARSIYAKKVATADWQYISLDLPVTATNAGHQFRLQFNGQYATPGYLLFDETDFFLVKDSTVAQASSQTVDSKAIAGVTTGSDLNKRCRTDTYSQVVGQEINGVVFCVLQSHEAFFDQNLIVLLDIADQTKTLSNKAGLKLPAYFLTDSDDDPVAANGKNFTAYYTQGQGMIYLIQDRGGILTNYARHEIGHYIDDQKGFSGLCFQYHCYSSKKAVFQRAFGMAKKSEIITKYAAENIAEMFAEFYQDISKDYLESDNQFKDWVSSYPIFTETIPFAGGSSTINNGKGKKANNSILYIYSYVSVVSNLGNPFEADTQSGFWSWEIEDGKFMKKAVVNSIISDHADSLMKIESKEKCFSLPDSNRFYPKINSQDFTTFTWWLGDPKHCVADSNALIAINSLSETVDFQIPTVPADYQGAVFLGQKVRLFPGANDLIEIKFQAHWDGPFYKEVMWPDGSGVQDTKEISLKDINFQAQASNGREIKMIKKGDIGRDPNFGSVIHDTEFCDYSTCNTENLVATILGGDVATRKETFTLGDGSQYLPIIFDNIRDTLNNGHNGQTPELVPPGSPYIFKHVLPLN